MTNYLAIREAAAYLHVHPNTLRLWERRGYITPARLIGPTKRRRYTVEELDSLLQRKEVKVD